MSISILKNDGLNRFEIYSDGELAGFAEFKIENQMISYTHTEIDLKFGGQGLGSQLIKEVNAKVFDLYINFLATKNTAWLNNAERELN